MAKPRKPAARNSSPRKASPARKLSKEQLAFQALQYSQSRPPIWPVVRSEDFELRGHRRALSWATALDLSQNLTLVSWAVRFHQNFTSSFEFQPRTDDPEYNAYLKSWFTKRTGKACDVHKRQSLSTMFRNWCAIKVLYGDALMAKIRDPETGTGRLQLVEAWQIAKGFVDGKVAPDKRAQAQAEVDLLNDQGLLLDDFGAVRAFGIASGDSSGDLVHRMLLPFDAAVYDGFFVRPTATRPPSPLLPAMNFARDFLDNVQYRLTRAKIEAMFGLVIHRDHNLVGNHDFLYGRGLQGAPPEANVAVPMLEYDLRPGLKLELEREDKAEFLESKTPSKEWLDFSDQLCRLILASLDIPAELFDGKGTNFSQQQSAFNLYKISAFEERDKNKAALGEAIDHILDGGVADDSLLLPRGIHNASDIPYALIPRGVFILDAARSVDAILKQLAAGLLTFADASHQLGNGEIDYIAATRGREEKMFRDNGVTISIGLPGQAVVGDAPYGDDQQEKPAKTENDDDDDDE